MGGNLLSVERLPRQEYLKVKQEMLEILTETSYFRRIRVPHENPDKPDFGDLDILVDLYDPPDFAKTFDPCTHPKIKSSQKVSHSPILSFEFRKFQVDLIRIPADEFDCSMLFYSYGDFGMLMSMMVRSAGFKFSASGLYLRATAEVAKDILLSTSPKEILDFYACAGSYKRWLQGFKSEKEVFDFIMSSRFFNDGRSFGGALQARDRGKMTDRPMFERFLKPLVNHNAETANTYAEALDDDVRDTAGGDMKRDYRVEALTRFNKLDEYEVLVRELDNRRTIKAKFNGKVIGGCTGLQDRELGCLMQQMRDTYTEDWFLVATPEEIVKAALATHAKMCVQKETDA